MAKEVGGAPDLSEHESLNVARRAVDDCLTSAVEEPQRWTAALSGAITDLTHAFELHVQVAEAPGGPLQQVVERRPEMAHAVERQRRDHVAVLSDLEQLQSRLDGAIHGAHSDPDAFRWRAGAVQDTIRRHMARANDLLYDAFARDDGGEG